MNKALPYICVAAAATCWGFTGLFNRYLTVLGFTQTQLFFVRCFVPLVVLGLWLLIRDRSAFRIRLRDLWMFLGSGLLSLTMFGLAYFSAMQVMSLSVAVVLLYTSPVWVVLLSAPLFKERITWLKVLALILVIVGPPAPPDSSPAPPLSLRWDCCMASSPAWDTPCTLSSDASP